MIILSIQEIRKSLGLSQSQFAKKFHLNVRTLQNWESGRPIPEHILYMVKRIIELESNVK